MAAFHHSAGVIHKSSLAAVPLGLKGGGGGEVGREEEGGGRWRVGGGRGGGTGEK